MMYPIQLLILYVGGAPYSLFDHLIRRRVSILIGGLFTATLLVVFFLLLFWYPGDSHDLCHRRLLYNMRFSYLSRNRSCCRPSVVIHGSPTGCSSFIRSPDRSYHTIASSSHHHLGLLRTYLMDIVAHWLRASFLFVTLSFFHVVLSLADSSLLSFRTMTLRRSGFFFVVHVAPGYATCGPRTVVGTDSSCIVAPEAHSTVQ